MTHGQKWLFGVITAIITVIFAIQFTLSEMPWPLALLCGLGMNVVIFLGLVCLLGGIFFWPIVLRVTVEILVWLYSRWSKNDAYLRLLREYGVVYCLFACFVLVKDRLTRTRRRDA